MTIAENTSAVRIPTDAYDAATLALCHAEGLANLMLNYLDLDALLSLSASGDRICPVPISWDQFWKLLGAPSQCPPLILAGWAHSSDRDKRERFQAQIRHAADHGMLDQAEAFIQALRQDQWHTCSPSGLDWNYGHAIAEDERNRDTSKD